MSLPDVLQRSKFNVEFENAINSDEAYLLFLLCYKIDIDSIIFNEATCGTFHFIETTNGFVANQHKIYHNLKICARINIFDSTGNSVFTFKLRGIVGTASFTLDGGSEEALCFSWKIKEFPPVAYSYSE